MSLPDSGLPTRAPIFLELFLTQPSSRIGTKGTKKVLATVEEVGASLDANKPCWQA